MVNDLEQRAQRDIADLKQLLSEAIDLATEVISGTRFGQNDHYAFMTVCFLAKFLEHAKAITILVENELGRDAEAIARLMIEGLCQLKWVAKDKQKRAFQWRGFVYVEDWRTMELRRAQGECLAH
ncbi:MAG: hypothetical protein HYX86_05950 [Chloroflexi bacterium]|nr:hypothetical protein [Chloroflexota bacterium]